MYSDITETIYTRIDFLKDSLDSGAFPVIVPWDWKGKITITPYLRFSILIPQGKYNSYNLGTTRTGLFIFDLFEEHGTGDRNRSQYFDLLDDYLANRVLASNLHTSSSYITKLGTDSANGNLYRTTYNLQFTYYGVT